MKQRLFALLTLVMAAGLVLSGCGAKGRTSSSPNPADASSGAASKYTPKTRTVNMTAVPQWIGEMGDIPAFKDFAPKDFKKGGTYDGNEVFSWQPTVMAACQGDTMKLKIANPGPDDHTFTLPDFSVNTPIPNFKITPVSFKVTKTGIFDYYCTIAEHTRYMHGVLMVFDDNSPMCANGSTGPA